MLSRAEAKQAGVDRGGKLREESEDERLQRGHEEQMRELDREHEHASGALRTE